jgi:hypothetical protein
MATTPPGMAVLNCSTVQQVAVGIVGDANPPPQVVLPPSPAQGPAPAGYLAGATTAVLLPTNSRLPYLVLTYAGVQYTVSTAEVAPRTGTVLPIQAVSAAPPAGTYPTPVVVFTAASAVSTTTGQFIPVNGVTVPHPTLTVYDSTSPPATATAVAVQVVNATPAVLAVTGPSAASGTPLAAFGTATVLPAWPAGAQTLVLTGALGASGPSVTVSVPFSSAVPSPGAVGAASVVCTDRTQTFGVVVTLDPVAGLWTVTVTYLGIATGAVVSLVNNTPAPVTFTGTAVGSSGTPSFQATPDNPLGPTPSVTVPAWTTSLALVDKPAGGVQVTGPGGLATTSPLPALTATGTGNTSWWAAPVAPATIPTFVANLWGTLVTVAGQTGATLQGASSGFSILVTTTPLVTVSATENTINGVNTQPVKGYLPQLISPAVAMGPGAPAVSPTTLPASTAPLALQNVNGALVVKVVLSQDGGSSLPQPEALSVPPESGADAAARWDASSVYGGLTFAVPCYTDAVHAPSLASFTFNAYAKPAPPVPGNPTQSPLILPGPSALPAPMTIAAWCPGRSDVVVAYSSPVAGNLLTYISNVCTAGGFTDCRPVGDLPQASCLGYFSALVGDLCAGACTGDNTIAGSTAGFINACDDLALAGYCKVGGNESNGVAASTPACACANLATSPVRWSVPGLGSGSGSGDGTMTFAEFEAAYRRASGNRALPKALTDNAPCWWPGCTGPTAALPNSFTKATCSKAVVNCFAKVNNVVVDPGAYVSEEINNACSGEVVPDAFSSGSYGSCNASTGSGCVSVPIPPEPKYSWLPKGMSFETFVVLVVVAGVVILGLLAVLITWAMGILPEPKKK